MKLEPDRDGINCDHSKLQRFLQRAITPAIIAKTGTDLSAFKDVSLKIRYSDWIPPNKIFLVDLFSFQINASETIHSLW